MANKNKQGVAETFDASQSSDAFFSKNKKVILGSVAALVLIVAGFFLYKSLVAGPPVADGLEHAAPGRGWSTRRKG